MMGKHIGKLILSINSFEEKEQYADYVAFVSNNTDHIRYMFCFKQIIIVIIT
jgi:hypothetical protein